jgi:hypothetical protein
VGLLRRSLSSSILRLWFVSFVLYAASGVAVVLSRSSPRRLVAFVTVGALPVQSPGEFLATRHA